MAMVRNGGETVLDLETTCLIKKSFFLKVCWKFCLNY